MNDEGALDADLARRAAGGDEAAYGQLMRRHKASLYRFCRRYVGDADAAMEVLQETFAAAWRRLDSYDAERPFATWARAIALNKCRDRARRAAVRRIVLGEKTIEQVDSGRLADPAVGPEAALIERERRAALDAAIAALPVQLKEPLILTTFEDMSHQEAAKLLGITPKAVETRLYRARQKLASALGIPE